MTAHSARHAFASALRPDRAAVEEAEQAHNTMSNPTVGIKCVEIILADLLATGAVLCGQVICLHSVTSGEAIDHLRLVY